MNNKRKMKKKKKSKRCLSFVDELKIKYMPEKTPLSPTPLSETAATRKSF
jgi:hypothetical protein